MVDFAQLAALLGLAGSDTDSTVFFPLFFGTMVLTRMSWRATTKIYWIYKMAKWVEAILRLSEYELANER